MWGQVSIVFCTTQAIRIIPTRVGTRGGTVYKARWNWDHPHACGDKAYTVGILLIPTGSSPRVWGQVYYHQINVYLRRIIPTRVGTSCLYNTFFIWSKDHPHACGDKHELCALRADMDGSSPRVWGQVSHF